METKVKNIINHVVFVVDASSSMSHLKNDVITVFDEQIRSLAEVSKQLDQETRVTVYSFGTQAECLIFDKDVLRIPSLQYLYKVVGATSLIDATLISIEDLEQTFQKYGDHSFLLFVITDGQENSSIKSPSVLQKKLTSLSKDWTIDTLVPDSYGRSLALNYGFPEKNIQIWETTKSGLTQLESTLRQATVQYMNNRSKGIRSTSNLFELDSVNLTSKNVKANLVEIKNYHELLVQTREDGCQIRDLVEKRLNTKYVKGSAFYQLTKPELIQSQKQICVRDKKNGKIYGGGDARELLGLPDKNVKVSPINFSNYDIFVQSTSVNRKLKKNTIVLVKN